MKLMTGLVALPAIAILLTFSVCADQAKAVIADQSENFNDGNFADNAALATAGYVFSDPNLSGLDTNQMGGGSPIGDPDSLDGVNDGGIFIAGDNFGDTVTFPFAGTIEDGAVYRFGTNLFQSGNSFTQATVQLLANGVVVEEIFDAGNISFNDQSSPAGGAYPATLYYQGTGATAGQTLSFRVEQTRGSNASMDVGIDNWELINMDLSSGIASQFDTLSTGQVPFGYSWTREDRLGYTTGDAVNPDLSTPAMGVYPGDAVGDGGIEVRGTNASLPLSVVEYRFDGVIEDGMRYDFTSFLWQSSSSFSQTDVQLVADPGGPGETILATVDPGNVGSGGNFASLTYTGNGSTAGQQMAFRVSSKRNAGGAGSRVGIDGWVLDVIDPTGPLTDQFENFGLGGVPAGYVFSTTGGHDTNDPLTAPYGVNPGDAASDGAIYVDGNDPNTSGNTVTYTFPGLIENGQKYDFDTVLYKRSTSFAESTIDLIADLGGGNETIVASLFQGGINGTADPNGPAPSSVGLSFIGNSSLDGKSLSLRVSSERGTGGSSDVGIDGWSLDVGETVGPLADQFETFSLGEVPAGYTFSGTGGHDTNDPNSPSYGANPGDAAFDGAIYVDGNDPNTPGNSVTHTFTGLIEDGQQYDFEALLYQRSTSFAESTIDLIADLGGGSESLVASLFLSAINGSADPNGNPPQLADLSFTGSPATDGLTLSFRISSERGVGGASDVGIDGWSLSLFTGIPGDFDGNGRVDSADFLLWQRNPAVGDLSDWEANYGNPLAPTTTSVPEPGSLVLLSFGALLALRRDRRES